MSTTTPRTDAATKTAFGVPYATIDFARTLETELQQAQAALAAVTLEWDEAKQRLVNASVENERLANLAAACQSREAKALEELKEENAKVLRWMNTAADWNQERRKAEAALSESLSDRDQLQAQVGAQARAILGVNEWCTKGTTVIRCGQEVFALIKDVLAVAPAAPDSAKEAP